MEEEFERWNKQKKEIALRFNTRFQFPKEKEVRMCILGKNIGKEQNGSGVNFLRPVLVVKIFNNQMFWIVPLSTKQKNLDFYYNFTDPNGTKVAAVLAQLRLVSITRFKRLVYVLPEQTYNTLRAALFSM